MGEGAASPQPHDRRSLAADVDVALSALGPETKAYLGATVRDYCAQEIPKLEEFLDDTAGAKRVLHVSRHTPATSIPSGSVAVAVTSRTNVRPPLPAFGVRSCARQRWRPRARRTS